MPKNYSKGSKVSVIIPAWIINDELYQLTSNTVASLSQSVGGFELIIVDNASSIGADQLLTVSDIYIRNKENLGYPKAVNQGCKLANGDFLCIANNDIRVSPNWIKVTREVFKKLPKAGSLHFKMVDYNTPFNISKNVWEDGKERWCHGSFFVWRRKAIEEMDYMDEGYGLGGYDDYDWQYRLRPKGWKTV
jgi:GT2 family glycosyltransferase